MEGEERGGENLREKKLSVVEEEMSNPALTQKKNNRISMSLAISGSESELEQDEESENNEPRASTPKERSLPILRNRDGPGCKPPDALNPKATESQVEAALAPFN